MNSSAKELANRLPNVDGLRRLGQSLWMMIEKPVEKTTLVWARGLLGERGDDVLWSALTDEGVLAPPEYRVNPVRLAGLLSILAAGEVGEFSLPRLVWTLPSELGRPELSESYSLAALKLAEATKDALLMVSPFLESRGVAKLLEAILAALKRGVEVTIVTHGAENLSSSSSTALKELRREASQLPGCLTVYSANEECSVLLHSKLIVSDDALAIVGSANVTGRGLGTNLEAGVILGSAHAAEITHIVEDLLRSGLVNLVFSNHETRASSA